MGLNPPAMPLIHIEELSKRFGVNAALQDVNLTLEAGSIHALLGQNGAGKSTIIKILSGLYTPTSGRITVAGHALGAWVAVRRTPEVGARRPAVLALWAVGVGSTLVVLAQPPQPVGFAT